MRKLLLIVFVVTGFTTNTFAQFNVGLKAGLNYSTIKAENNEFNESGILGYHVGAWARVGSSVYLQPELYLGSKGADLKFTQEGTTVEQSGKARFTTLDVPVLLGTKIGLESFNVRLMAGPAFQFNLDTDDSAFSQAVNPDFYRYRDFVTNLQAGAGVDFGNLSIDLRYETSLKDINKNDGQKQNLIHLGVGFKLL